jgi:hypothetical protein
MWLSEYRRGFDWYYNTQKAFSVFNSRSPSSGFPNCHQPQLPACHFSQLQISTDSLQIFSNGSWSSLYSHGTDRTANVSSIIACSLVVGEKLCPRRCSLATAVALSPVYIAVTWYIISFHSKSDFSINGLHVTNWKLQSEFPLPRNIFNSSLSEQFQLHRFCDVSYFNFLLPEKEFAGRALETYCIYRTSIHMQNSNEPRNCYKVLQHPAE